MPNPKEAAEERAMLAEKLNAALESAGEVLADLNEALAAKNSKPVTPAEPSSSHPVSDKSK